MPHTRTHTCTRTHARTHTHTHTTCPDLQHSTVEVDPVHQRVLMGSVGEDSQHAGYRHWQDIHQVTLLTNWDWEGSHNIGWGGGQMGWNFHRVEMDLYILHALS